MACASGHGSVVAVMRAAMSASASLNAAGWAARERSRPSRASLRSEAAQFDDVGRGQMPNGAQQFTLLPGGEGRVDDNGLAKSQQLLGQVCQVLVGPAGELRGVDTLAKPRVHMLSRRDA